MAINKIKTFFLNRYLSIFITIDIILFFICLVALFASITESVKYWKCDILSTRGWENFFILFDKPIKIFAGIVALSSLISALLILKDNRNQFKFTHYYEFRKVFIEFMKDKEPFLEIRTFLNHYKLTYPFDEMKLYFEPYRYFFGTSYNNFNPSMLPESKQKVTILLSRLSKLDKKKKIL